MKNRFLTALTVAVFLASFTAITAGPAAALEIDVSGRSFTQYPVAIARFKIDGSVPQDVAAVVRNDLLRSGIFKIVDAGVELSDTDPIDFGALRAKGADAIVGGSIVRMADGRFDIRYRLTDAVRRSTLGGESILAASNDLRYAGHRIADFVYNKLAGQKGIFTTRIAFVTRRASGTKLRYRLNISDWDGKNIQTALTSPEPIISPAWSPDGKQLAYVSFETQKPVVYVHTLSTGMRRAVANFRGSNSAPGWSPDSKTLAVALTRDRISQIYIVNALKASKARKIVSSSGIDTEPQFAPDGNTIYFSSDRGGSPQIYKIDISTRKVARVTFDSAYNVSPRVSPDGKSLAFVTRRNGQHFIALKDLTTGQETILSDGGREESPSFSPNGLWLMYATRINGRDMLMASSVDGLVKQRLSTDAGDIREPTWGPFGS